MNRALVLLLHLLAVCCVSSGKVVLMGNNITRSFDDIEANFAMAIKDSGEMGELYIAEPLDACKDLSNGPENGSNGTSPFVLIIRGGCSFEDKVRKAQRAGFKAAVVYNNEDSGALISMAGNSGGIKIHAVFVSKASGETLKKYAGLPNTKVWLISSFENSAWSIMAISFISLLAMSAVLATCFFVRRHRIRRRTSRSSRVREFHGMSRRLVKAMPSLVFTSVHEGNTTATSCAICLEDYSVGEKLRVLPCRHKFHAMCVDTWLTSWRTFCPVCKRDARTSTGEPPASESTPLLSPAASSSVLSSFRSSIPMSSALHIGSLPSSVSFSPGQAGSSYIIQHSFRSSPPINMSRSSVDLRQQVSPSQSQRSYTMSRMASPNSLGFPATSPLNSRYMSPSPVNPSPGLYIGSSNHRFRPLHCSESAGTFSPFNSAHSLTDC
ncbi:PREDICTED: receptor homology region, transmembrane domain- and RING domain-containing protein 2 [Tarenaya hassleriana]|uniref:receptor homology region, transmembrane domain- and RING domain-containing protein 2 n=1 Tax=Tarenaya hassleriana TaxID=28532 RepID=UPI00053C5874|nr:PREDICTED: receptor homology region, transmembrane domain- and RING domain-containing protein 2 [Tarenaya hassleriana]